MTGPPFFLQMDLAGSLLPLPLGRRAICSHLSNSAQWVQAGRLPVLITHLLILREEFDVL